MMRWTSSEKRANNSLSMGRMEKVSKKDSDEYFPSSAYHTSSGVLLDVRRRAPSHLTSKLMEQGPDGLSCVCAYA